MSQANTDVQADLARVSDLVARLIQRNHDLTAECDSLYEHIEALNHQLAAHTADLNTSSREAPPTQQLMRDEAQRDQIRIERLRAELDAYLSEIDARLASRNQHA